MNSKFIYLEMHVSVHEHSDGLLCSCPHSRVLLLGVLEEEREEGGEERVRDGL
jgi:selenophosphate synthase